MERNIDLRPCGTFLMNFHIDVMWFENTDYLFHATSWKANVLGEDFTAGYDPRLTVGREPHRLSFVKFGVLKSCDANQAIYHSGRQALFLDIYKIAHHHTNIRRQRTGDLPFLSFPRWAPEPWCLALVFIGQMEVHSDGIPLGIYRVSYSSELIDWHSLNGL